MTIAGTNSLHTNAKLQCLFLQNAKNALPLYSKKLHYLFEIPSSPGSTVLQP